MQALEWDSYNTHTHTRILCTDVENLKLMMNLLRDKSAAIRADAFQIFKVCCTCLLHLRLTEGLECVYVLCVHCASMMNMMRDTDAGTRLILIGSACICLHMFNLYLCVWCILLSSTVSLFWSQFQNSGIIRARVHHDAQVVRIPVYLLNFKSSTYRHTHILLKNAHMRHRCLWAIPARRNLFWTSFGKTG